MSHHGAGWVFCLAGDHGCFIFFLVVLCCLTRHTCISRNRIAGVLLAISRSGHDGLIQAGHEGMMVFRYIEQHRVATAVYEFE